MNLVAAVPSFPPTSTRDPRASDPPSETRGDLLSPQDQIPPGVLIEWCGPEADGKLEALWPRLQPRGVWLELRSDPATVPTAEIYPLALQTRLRHWWGARVPASDLGWCILQILRSGWAQQILLSENCSLAWGEGDAPLRTTWLRRLQIQAQRSQAHLFFLRHTPSRSGLWPIAVQTWTKRDPLSEVPQTQILKWLSRRSHSWFNTTANTRASSSPLRSISAALSERKHSFL